MTDYTHINDGGPAFPMPSGNEPRVNETTHYNEGMSLRDWFAGQALQGLCASQWGGLQRVSTFVERAYEMADAMLAAREGGTR